jgi:inner membrane protein
MATALTHGFVAAALGKAAFPERMTARFLVLAVGCSLLPDLDVIGFQVGVRYADMFGHRGFSHSLLFALLVALLIAFFAFRSERVFSKRWWGLVLFFFSVGATHGVLDAMTNGGYGVAFFSPFDRTRYFLPWQPLHVSPISINGFLSRKGLSIIMSELRSVWLPMIITVIGILLVRRKRSSNPPSDERCAPHPE